MTLNLAVIPKHLVRKRDLHQQHLKFSQTETKGKGDPKKRQAVLNFEQGCTRLQVKMPFNKSSDSHDSEKIVAGPSTKRHRTTKNSNKDKDIEGEKLGSKSSKKEKQSKMLSQKKRSLSVKASDST